MSQKSFLDNKKSQKNFPYVGRGGVNQHMENSICFVVFIFESFPYHHLAILWETINGGNETSACNDYITTF